MGRVVDIHAWRGSDKFEGGDEDVLEGEFKRELAEKRVDEASFRFFTHASRTKGLG
jgi:hypothetical protein